MTTTNSILVSNVRSNKSENMVWAVYVQGNEQEKCYCKSPYKAMRYAFYLKKQTGLYISDICLARLSLEIKRIKEASLTPEQIEAKERIDEAVEQFVEEHSVDNVLAKDDEAKAKGKRKAAKSAADAEAAAEPKAKKQRKPRSKKQEKVAA